MADKELSQRLKDGDPEAFKELVDLYKSKVINTCYRFLNNREEAEDVTQDVFVEVYQSISSFREEARLSTWIYRIAVTKSLDNIRKMNRKKRLNNLKSFFRQAQQIEHIPAPSDTRPDKRLETQERSRILQKAIESLVENQKIAITLSQYEGFSNREIADIMDTTLSSVESLMHRAKKNLKKRLYSYYERKY